MIHKRKFKFEAYLTEDPDEKTNFNAIEELLGHSCSDFSFKSRSYFDFGIETKWRITMEEISIKKEKK